METPVTPDVPPASPQSTSPHLICGPARGVVAVAVCLYFAYSSYEAIRTGEVQWQHETWTMVTWVVWLLLASGLFSEIRCRRERIVYALVAANCLIGLVGSGWASMPFATARRARELSLVFWLLASLGSIAGMRKLPTRATGDEGSS